METLRTITSDVRRTLKQTKDDLEIPELQLMYWVLVVADRLRMQHIVKRRSGAYLTTFVLPVIADTTFTERRYAVLPRSIYDIDLDGGIESLCYYKPSQNRPEFSLVTFFRISPSELRGRNLSTYQKSALDHPYLCREGDRLYMYGVHDGLKNIEAKLYCNLPDINSVDPDAPLDFPKELIYPLTRAVLDMGRFALSLPGEYLVNDGTPRRPSAVAGAPEKTVSVNSALANPDE